MSKFRKEAFFEKEDKSEWTMLFLDALNKFNAEIYFSFTTEKETSYRILGPESLVKAIRIEKDATSLTMSQEASPRGRFIAVSPEGIKYPKAKIEIEIGRDVLVTVLQCGAAIFRGAEGQSVIVSN